MESKGLVIDKNGNKIKVRMYKETACDHCHGCSEEQKFARYFDFVSDRDVNVGDMVVFQVESATLIKNAFIVYLIPIIAMMIGYYVGANILGYSENKSIVTCFAFFVVTFGGVVCYDRLVRKRDANADVEIIDVIPHMPSCDVGENM